MDETNELRDILQDIDARLTAAGIDYMIVGSLASSFYGEPRFTRDIDVVVQLNVSDALRLLSAFEPDYVGDEGAARDAIRYRSSFNLIHRRILMKVDFMILKADSFGESEFGRRRRANLAGAEIWVASPEDTLLYKLHWRRESGSDVQLRDVAGIIEANPDLDWTYLEKWGHYLKVRKEVLDLKP